MDSLEFHFVPMFWTILLRKFIWLNAYSHVTYCHGHSQSVTNIVVPDVIFFCPSFSLFFLFCFVFFQIFVSDCFSASHEDDFLFTHQLVR